MIYISDTGFHKNQKVLENDKLHISALGWVKNINYINLNNYQSIMLIK